MYILLIKVLIYQLDKNIFTFDDQDWDKNDIKDVKMHLILHDYGY